MTSRATSGTVQDNAYVDDTLYSGASSSFATPQAVLIKSLLININLICFQILSSCLTVHAVSIVKTSRLLLYGIVIDICSENRTKRINTFCGMFLLLNLVSWGSKVSIMLTLDCLHKERAWLEGVLTWENVGDWRLEKIRHWFVLYRILSEDEQSEIGKFEIYTKIWE